MQRSKNELMSVFKAFDLDNSGGIDLEELQSAASVLGIPAARDRIKQMFREADADGSGEIDFDEFCKVVEKGDGGMFARLINKVIEDGNVRDIVATRVRPKADLPGPLLDQLARLREERKWLSQVHMNTTHAQVHAAKLGYVNERSVFMYGEREEPGALPPSPVRITDPLADSHSQPSKLMPTRTLRRMLPDDEEDENPRRSVSLQHPRPPAIAAVMQLGGRPRPRRSARPADVKMELASSPLRSVSMPMRRPQFHAGNVGPGTVANVGAA